MRKDQHYRPAAIPGDPRHAEIDEALAGYQRAVRLLARADADPIHISIWLGAATMWTTILASHGVTVAGGIGHA